MHFSLNSYYFNRFRILSGPCADANHDDISRVLCGAGVHDEVGEDGSVLSDVLAASANVSVTTWNEGGAGGWACGRRDCRSTPGTPCGLGHRGHRRGLLLLHRAPRPRRCRLTLLFSQCVGLGARALEWGESHGGAQEVSAACARLEAWREWLGGDWDGVAVVLVAHHPRCRRLSSLVTPVLLDTVALSQAWGTTRGGTTGTGVAGGRATLQRRGWRSGD